jgi:hypothetical protein
MQGLDHVLDALTAVLDWGIPEEGYCEAISAQVGHLAGLDSDDLADSTLDVTVH